MFLGLTPQVLINRFVPVLFNAVPVSDEATLQDLANFVCSFVVPSLLANEEVEVRVLKLVLPSSLQVKG